MPSNDKKVRPDHVAAMAACDSINTGQVIVVITLHFINYDPSGELTSFMNIYIHIYDNHDK